MLGPDRWGMSTPAGAPLTTLQIDVLPRQPALYKLLCVLGRLRCIAFSSVSVLPSPCLCLSRYCGARFAAPPRPRPPVSPNANGVAHATISIQGVTQALSIQMRLKKTLERV
jgi:hypothetical protein